MARKAKRRRKTEDVHSFLVIKVARHEARVEAAVNHNVYQPQYALHLDDNDPLYEFTSQFTICGLATSPKDRAGDTFELTVYGDDAPSRRHGKVLSDAQARNEHGAPQYREYRGGLIPIYDPPKGVGYLDKVRGERRWQGWLFAPTRFVNDALVVLNHGKTLYLAIHERRAKRTRWMQSVCLQTTDPEEE